MIFAFLVLISALFIESIGTFISISGLGKLFADNMVIMVLAGALDFGKIMSVSFLHRHWKAIPLVMKGYMTTAVVVLMIITSTGCFGYLSSAFQQSISGEQKQNIVLVADQAEQTRLLARKKEIDTQISSLKTDDVIGRRQLSKTFGAEVTSINTRLATLDTEIPKLQVQGVQQNSDVGPIIYVAQVFNTDPAHAVKWVILIIIFVFDPLAVALLLAGNYLIEEEEKKKLKKLESPHVTPAILVDEPDDEAEEPVELEAHEDEIRSDDRDDREDQIKEELEQDEVHEDVENPIKLAEENKAAPYDYDDTLLAIGNRRARDSQVDEVDHITDEDLTVLLGRKKDRYEDQEEIRPALNDEGRPVISLAELNKGPIPRSSLEDVRTIDPLEAIIKDQARHSNVLSHYRD